MSVKLLTEQYLEFLSFKGGCTGSSESIHVKMPHLLEITSIMQYYTAQYTVQFYHAIFGAHMNGT